MPACHVREAHGRRCPTGTARDTPVCEREWGFAVSNCPLVVVVLLDILIVHSYSHLLLGFVYLVVVRTGKEELASSHHECHLSMPPGDFCERTPLMTSSTSRGPGVAPHLTGSGSKSDLTVAAWRMSSLCCEQLWFSLHGRFGFEVGGLL